MPSESAQLSRDESHAPLRIKVKTQFAGSSTKASTASGFSLDVDLSLPNNAITAIYGESGSGKTTLLRCIAGLETVSEGEITINNETWHDKDTSVPAHQRAVGYVFQEASLFQHLTVEGNLNYAQKRADANYGGINKQQIVELMGIGSLLTRKVGQLSGGERQRVAIARALLIHPQVLLMDEPLAALDVQRRQEILPYLERLHQEIAIPIFYVTHSLEEVSRLADYLVVLEQGRVIAQGNLIDMLSRSDLSLGGEEEVGAVLEGRIESRNAQWHLAHVVFPGGSMQIRDSAGLGEVGKNVRIRILARDISLSLDAEQRSSILNRLQAEILTITDTRDPAMNTVQLKVGESILLARISRRSVAELDLQPGQSVWAQIKSVAILR